METIAKFIKAFFFGDDGEIEKTTVQKVKDAVLWILLGAGLLIGLICIIPDEDEQEENDTEYVEEVE